MKNIIIYAGSFNPMTIGHLNIIEKAERVFGKGNVIVAIGINPDKVVNIDKEYLDEKSKLAQTISEKIGRTVITYSKFLHQVVEDYEAQGYNVVILRGLRNGVDLDYEVNQVRFIHDFKKDVNVVYITCDKEFEHISSSAIRKIEQFGGSELAKQYLVC